MLFIFPNAAKNLKKYTPRFRLESFFNQKILLKTAASSFLFDGYKSLQKPEVFDNLLMFIFRYFFKDKSRTFEK